MKTHALLFCLLALVLTACQAPLSAGSPSVGNSVTLTVEFGQTAKSILPQSLKFDHFRVTGTGPRGATVPGQTLTDSLTLKDLEVGPWTFTIDGCEADDQVTVSATVEAEVVLGENIKVPVYLLPVAGDGSLQISVSWPFNGGVEEVSAVFRHGADPSVKVPMVISGGTSATGSLDVPSGSGTLVLRLKAAGKDLIAPRTEAVTVFRNRTSFGAFGLASADFGPAVQRSRIPWIGTGQDFMAALKNDGTVWVWGKNNHGQLGNGTYAPSATPTAVAGLSSVVAIGVGECHVVALKADGTVWSWGSNEQGQVGNASGQDQNTPVRVFQDAVALGSSRYASYAIKANGELYGWGVNWGCGLGDGTGDNRSSPTKLLAADVVAIGGEESTTLALKKDGSVWGWGSRMPGQSDLVKTPMKIMDDGFDVSSGSPIVVKKDGTAWSWKPQGQLYQVTDSVSRIAPTFWGLGLIKKDGSFWCWDYDWGSGTYTNPQKALDNVVAGSAWGAMAALRADGSLWTWGGNSLGQLGLGVMDSLFSPTRWGSFTADDISQGLSQILVKTSSGTVVATTGESPAFSAVSCLGVGGNETDQYKVVDGDGVLWSFGGDRGSTPVQALTGVTRVLPSYQMTLALKTDGTVWTWGRNEGMLGNGAMEDNPTPQDIGLTGVKAVSVGGWHSLALKEDGTLVGWGCNDCGQLGAPDLTNVKHADHQGSDYNGDFSVPLEPVTVKPNVHRFWGGRRYSVVETNDGKFFGLGDGLPYGKPGWFHDTPVDLDWTDVADLACGGYHVLILKTDGSVWGLGDNSYGQLGQANSHDRVTEPVKILDGAKKVMAGIQSSSVLMTDGSVKVFGESVDRWVSGRPDVTKPEQAIGGFTLSADR